MTPPIHYLKPVWEIHLSLIQFASRSYPVSSLSQCCQIIGRVIHMFKRSSAETYIESTICSCPFSSCRPSLCPVQLTSYSVSPSKSVTHFVSLMGDTSRLSCDEFCSVDFSSLFRINIYKFLVPWNLHASMAGFLAFDSGFTSLTLDRKIPSNVQLQHIHSHSMDCTRVPWESLTLMVISLTLFNGFINDR
jgi:hypothetical protein